MTVPWPIPNPTAALRGGVCRAGLAGLLALSACAVEPDAYGVQMLPPDDVEFAWDVSLNGMDDGLGAVVPLDVMVYDGLTGAPLPGVAVQLAADHAALLGDDSLMAGADEADVVARCAECVAFWDTHLDRTVGLRPLGVREGSAAAAGRVRWTDEDGMVRLYAVVDALPERAGSYEPARVVISAGEHEAVVSLRAH